MGLYRAIPSHTDGTFLNYCKTNRKPYDLMVQATLILYEHHFMDKVRVKSDGSDVDWLDAYLLVRKVLKKRTHKERIAHEINEFLSLKLFGNLTFIYVNKHRFDQCKFLMLVNPQNDPDQALINSIDETEQVLSHL